MCRHGRRKAGSARVAPARSDPRAVMTLEHAHARRDLAIDDSVKTSGESGPENGWNGSNQPTFLPHRSSVATIPCNAFVSDWSASTPYPH